MQRLKLKDYAARFGQTKTASDSAFIRARYSKLSIQKET